MLLLATPPKVMKTNMIFMCVAHTYHYISIAESYQETAMIWSAVIYRSCNRKYCQFWNRAEVQLQYYHYTCCPKKKFFSILNESILHNLFHCYCFHFRLANILGKQTRLSYAFILLLFFGFVLLLVFFFFFSFLILFPLHPIPEKASLMKVYLILPQLFETHTVFRGRKDKIQISK